MIHLHKLAPAQVFKTSTIKIKRGEKIKFLNNNALRGASHTPV
jgi:plastocyanin